MAKKYRLDGGFYSEAGPYTIERPEIIPSSPISHEKIIYEIQFCIEEVYDETLIEQWHRRGDVTYSARWKDGTQVLMGRIERLFSRMVPEAGHSGGIVGSVEEWSEKTTMADCLYVHDGVEVRCGLFIVDYKEMKGVDVRPAIASEIYDECIERIKRYRNGGQTTKPVFGGGVDGIRRSMGEDITTPPYGFDYEDWPDVT